MRHTAGGCAFLALALSEAVFAQKWIPPYSVTVTGGGFETIDAAIAAWWQQFQNPECDYTVTILDPDEYAGQVRRLKRNGACENDGQYFFVSASACQMFTMVFEDAGTVEPGAAKTIVVKAYGCLGQATPNLDVTLL